MFTNDSPESLSLYILRSRYFLQKKSLPNKIQMDIWAPLIPTCSSYRSDRSSLPTSSLDFCMQTHLAEIQFYAIFHSLQGFPPILEERHFLEPHCREECSRKPSHPFTWKGFKQEDSKLFSNNSSPTHWHETPFLWIHQGCSYFYLPGNLTATKLQKLLTLK